MIIAALDTSCGISFAVAKDHEIIASFSLNLHMGALAQVAPLITNCLKEHQLHLRDIEHWVVGTGPGSFTGIRIGVAFVKAICLSTQATYQGISTSEALILSLKKHFPNATKMAVLYDGRKEELLYDAYECQNQKPLAMAPPQVIENQQLSTYLETLDAVITNNHAVVAPLVTTSQSHQVIYQETIDAKEFISLCDSKAYQTRQEMEDSCEPIYVRPAVFVLPKPSRIIN